MPAQTQAHFRIRVSRSCVDVAHFPLSARQGKDYRVTLTRQVPTMVDKQNQECARAVYRSM
jgi:hypothetical protein